MRICMNPEKDHEQIEKILEKYREDSPSLALKEKIYDDLMRAKHAKKISTPFQVILRKDPTGVHRDFVEVILETKV